MNRTVALYLALPVVVAAAAASADTPAPLEQVAQATVQVIAPNAPPPPRVEEIPPPPTPNTVVWEPGYWSYSGSNWVWVAGHYAERPSPQAVWQPGHWVEEADGWRWIDGRWLAAGG